MTTSYATHDLYKTKDADAPDVIKDRNGEVVLGLCRRCGRGEIRLSEPCMTTTDASPYRKDFDADLLQEQVAQTLYESVSPPGGTNWRWEDSGLDDEYPGARKKYFRQAAALLAKFDVKEKS